MQRSCYFLRISFIRQLALVGSCLYGAKTQFKQKQKGARPVATGEGRMQVGDKAVLYLVERGMVRDAKHQHSTACTARRGAAAAAPARRHSTGSEYKKMQASCSPLQRLALYNQGRAQYGQTILAAPVAGPRVTQCGSGQARKLGGIQ